MDINASFVIDEYLTKQQNIFTVEDFYRYLKSQGVKITKNQVFDVLTTSDMVFSLVNREFVTRAGVFTGRWFSFKPTKEEVQKGYIVLGHRCMPFINPELAPDRITVSSVNQKNIPVKAVTFSMNLAMDLFALYGEGYVIPYVINDHSNEKIQLSSIQYNMPSEITLTAWPLDKIVGEQKFSYGDRILGRVINWEENEVELTVLKADSSSTLSQSDIEREEWYSSFEKGLLDSFDKNGPGNSIEQQLAFLYLENQECLCNKNCGSAEEFLKHTKKIGFSSYGVESRIWKNGETVPFIGPWNDNFSSEVIFSDVTMSYTPQIIDAYLENYIYESFDAKGNEKSSEELVPLEQLMDTMFPQVLRMNASERKVVLLNIEKRHVILKKQYNQFSDHRLAAVRKRVIELFSKISALLCSIGCSGLQLQEFPQQELVILVQLFGHISRIIEEMENVFTKDSFPVEDVSLSLEGMEDTYDDVGEILQKSLEENTYKNLKIVK